MTRPPDGRSYVRAIEAAWSRFSARPTVLSPREFELVEGWRRRGVPLAVVLEVLEHQARRGGGRRPRSLAYLTPAVEQAWAAVAVGRAADASPPPPFAPRSARERWSEAFGRAPQGTPLHALLARLLERSDAGDDPGSLDEALDAALADAVPAELRERCDRETSAALAPFRERMTAEEFRRTCRRGRDDRLREALGLPRLGLER